MKPDFKPYTDAEMLSGLGQDEVDRPLSAEAETALRDPETARQRPARASRRRRGWLGWLGFPSRADAAQHLRMIWLHFLSLTGWRA